jgi:hypothetical protein
MRTVVITKHGDPSVLQVQQRPDPGPPGPGQLRVAVRAAGVNFADHLARVGLYPDAPKLPAVVGYEVGGPSRPLATASIRAASANGYWLEHDSVATPTSSTLRPPTPWRSPTH